MDMAVCITTSVPFLLITNYSRSLSDKKVNKSAEINSTVFYWNLNIKK